MISNTEQLQSSIEPGMTGSLALEPKPQWGEPGYMPATLIDNADTVFVTDVHAHVRQVEKLERMYPGVRIALGGDFIDGPNVPETIEWAKYNVRELGGIAMIGNHEWGLNAALHEGNGERREIWRDQVWRPRRQDGRYAGLHDGTLKSYGVNERQGNREALSQLRERMDERGHLDFLRGLSLYVESPDFIMVHAGLLEGPSWEEQRKRLDQSYEEISNPEHPSFSSDPPQIFDRFDRVRKTYLYSLTATRPTGLLKGLITGHQHFTASPEERATDNGMRFRLASKLHHGEPLYALQSWDREIKAITNE